VAIIDAKELPPTNLR